MAMALTQWQTRTHPGWMLVSVGMPLIVSAVIARSSNRPAHYTARPGPQMREPSRLPVYFFILSLAMLSLDTLSFDILSFDMLSLAIFSFFIVSFDMLSSLDMVSFFMS